MTALLRCCLCCALFLFSLSANAQSAEARKLLPRAELFAAPSHREVQLGSEGKRIWYRRADVPDTLYYTSARNSRYAHALALPGRLMHYRTVPGGGLVVVTASASEARLHYWRHGRLEEVTPFPLTDARVLATSHRFPNKVVLRLSAKDETRSGVWMVDLWGSKPRRIGRYDAYEALWFDQMFNPVAAEASDGAGGRLLLAFSAGSTDTLGYYSAATVPHHAGGLQHIVSVSADGKSVFFTDDEGRDKVVLMRYARLTKRFDKLAQDAQADIVPQGAVINRDGHVQAVLARWADARYRLVEEAIRADFYRLDSLLEGQVYWAGASADDSLWLVHTLGGTPARYYTYDRRQGRLYPLFSAMPALAASQLGKRRAWTVRTADSLALPVHVYLPPQSDRNEDGLPREPLPTLFFVYDAPRAALLPWDEWAHLRHFQLLANRGYAVVVCAPASATTSPHALSRDEKHRHLMDIVDWAIQQRIAHPDRLALWGCPHATETLMHALAREPERFRCALATHGLAGPETPHDEAEAEADTLGTHPVAPWVGQIQTPLFLAAAGHDSCRLRRQMDALAHALAEAEAAQEPVYVIYPEAARDTQAATWISFWALAEQFLARHLGGRYQAAGDDAARSKYELVYGQDFMSRIDW